jgi:hypothetical protein
MDVFILVEVKMFIIINKVLRNVNNNEHSTASWNNISTYIL